MNATNLATQDAGAAYNAATIGIPTLSLSVRHVRKAFLILRLQTIHLWLYRQRMPPFDGPCCRRHPGPGVNLVEEREGSWVCRLELVCLVTLLQSQPWTVEHHPPGSSPWASAANSQQLSKCLVNAREAARETAQLHEVHRCNWDEQSA